MGVRETQRKYYSEMKNPRRPTRKKRKRRAAALVSESKRRQEAKRLRRLSYSDYLKTSHWQYVRKRALWLADGKCQECGGTERLQVHHLTYERLGCERRKDVIVLCRLHHLMTHWEDPDLPSHESTLEEEMADILRE